MYNYICYVNTSHSTQSDAPAALFFFFFNDTATTEIYTLSLHDALPIYGSNDHCPSPQAEAHRHRHRSEEHTSELQSRVDLVCRLLLEKKKLGRSSKKTVRQNGMEITDGKNTGQS